MEYHKDTGCDRENEMSFYVVTNNGRVFGPEINSSAAWTKLYALEEREVGRGGAAVVRASDAGIALVKAEGMFADA